MQNNNRFRAAVVLGLAGMAIPMTVGASAQAATTDAEVTVVHGIPKTPVDVYVNGKEVLKDVVFGTVSKPLALAPGTYTVALRAHGASASSKALLSKVVTLKSGENATVVADLSTAGSAVLTGFQNPTAALPVKDARVIVRHVADAPGVDVYDGTKKVVKDLTDHHQATLVIPAASAAIHADVTATATTVIGPKAFHFTTGTTTIIYAIGSAAGKTLTVAVQRY